ncbi:hypothetical protein BH23CHL2_BH23CHL2_30560 [soil metagenome]
MHLASELQEIQPQMRDSPWAGHEHYHGYGVMVMPFSSGHLLGLRVFPDTDFGPYRSVWHRTPGGDWSIFNDGHSLDTTCPRWWGPVLKHASLTGIDVTWTGPSVLRVTMEEPQLEWTMSISASLPLRAINKLSAKLPSWTWKVSPLVSARESMAKRLLGMGDLRFTFPAPNGSSATVMCEQIYFIESSEAILEGQSLGHPVRLPANPTIGDVALPTRPSFFVGKAYARIDDPDEYRQTREEVSRQRPELVTAGR